MKYKIDWSKISTNPEIIKLIKQIEKLEKTISKLDPDALIKYELHKLSLPDNNEN